MPSCNNAWITSSRASLLSDLKLIPKREGSAAVFKGQEQGLSAVT